MSSSPGTPVTCATPINCTPRPGHHRSERFRSLVRAGSAVGRHVHAGIARGDIGQRLLVPVAVTGAREPEEVALTHRALRYELGPSAWRILRPRHLPAP